MRDEGRQTLKAIFQQSRGVPVIETRDLPSAEF